MAEMASQLGKRHDVQVFQTGEKKEKPHTVIRIRGIPYKSNQGPGGSIFWFGRLLYTQFFYHFLVLLFTIKCIPYLWKEKYDWIIPVNGRWQVIICRIIRFIRGGKILISGHAGVGFEDRFNIVLGNPDIFVALTPGAHRWAKNIQCILFRSRPRIEYIPNGVDTESFNPNIQPVKLNLPKPVVLCISALLPYKQVDCLIRTVAKLFSVSVLIIGDGPLRKNLEELGIKMLKDRFRLIPYVTHENIPRYYKATDVFSLPSKESEAFGLVYLEALACNIPVVAPDDENRRVLIQDGGLFCNPENTDQYAGIIKKALKTNFGNKPRIQAEKHSWDNIANQYEKIMVSSG